MKPIDQPITNEPPLRPLAELKLVDLTQSQDADSAKPGELTAILDWARRGSVRPEALAAERASPALRLAYSQSEPLPADEKAADCDDIVAYWHAVRGIDALPLSNDVDPISVARRWPGCVMLSVADGGEQIALDTAFARVVRMTRETAARPIRAQIDYSPMVMDWVIGIGRIAARLGKTASDVEVFPSGRHQLRYRVIGLPFVDRDGAIDRVLCHVAPV